MRSSAGAAQDDDGASPEVTVAVAVAGAAEAEMALDALIALGAVDATELWRERGRHEVLARFDAAPDGLAIDFLRMFSESVTVRPARRADWLGTWADALRPVQVGPVWIVPDDVLAPPGADRVLRLAIGEAFGTGLHPTTALCLERLAELPPTASILDVGTGTGVLALVALALGTDAAWATDIDPASLRLCTENAATAGMAERLVAVDAAPDRLGRQFPRIVANLLAGPLVDLAPAFARALAPGGELSVSGIREDQADRITRALRHVGLHDIGRASRDGWVRLDLVTSW